MSAVAPLVGIPSFTLSSGNAELSAQLLADISSIEVSEDRNTPAMLAFSVNLWDGMRQQLKEDYLDKFALGTPLELTLGIGEETQIFSGEVTALEPEFGDVDGQQSLNVRAYSRLHRLQFGNRQRTFQKKSSSDIATEIADELGLSATVEATNDKHPHITQNETDLAFLLRLAKPLNYEVAVDDTTLYFRQPNTQEGSVISLTYRYELTQFSPRQRVIPEGAKVEVRGWDVKNKKLIVGSAGAGDETSKMGGTQSGAEVSAAAFTSTTRTITAQTLNDVDEATQIAKAWYNRQQSNFIEAHGESIGSPLIRAGKTIEILGVGKVFSGIYYVESVKHTIGPNGYQTQFEITRNSV